MEKDTSNDSQLLVGSVGVTGLVNYRPFLILTLWTIRGTSG